MSSQGDPMSTSLFRPALAATIALLFMLPACKGQRDAQALLADAASYRQKGELKAAVIQLKNVIQQQPDNAQARAMLGEVYVEQGDPVSADKELRRARMLGAARESVLPLLGKALLMQGQFQKVLDEIKQEDGVKIAASINVLRASALLGLGQADAARTTLAQALQSEPGHADALLATARLAMVDRQTEVAMGKVEQVLSAAPNNTDALRLKGDMLRMQGLNDQAATAYQRILALQPNNAQANIDLANLLIDASKLAEARTHIEAARKSMPASLTVLYALALLDFREGKNQASLDSLLQILRAAPEHMPSVLLAGAVRLAMGSPQQAEAHLRVFLQAYPLHPYATKLMASIQLGNGNPSGALQLLAPLLSGDNQDVEVFAVAGEANLRLRRFSEATALFEKASALRPSTPMLRTALALSKMGSGDTQRAIGELETANKLELASDPAAKSSRTAVLLVMSYLRAGSVDKALELVNSMEKQGNNPLIQNLKGGVYLARRDLDQARASFMAAGKLDPSYLPALDNLAQLDALEGHPEQALKRYAAAQLGAPKNGALMEALARQYAIMGNKVEAQKWLERAHAEQPESVPAALRLADFYLRSGTTDKAMVLARQVQASHQANPEALAMLARVQYTANDYPAALESYAKLAVLLPDSPMVHTHIAMVHIANKNETSALVSLKRALAMQPDMLDAQLTQIRILLEQKRFAEAQAVIATVKKQLPASPVPLQLEGDLLMAQDRSAAAVTVYDKAHAIDKAGPSLVLVATALTKSGKTAEADLRLASFLKERPRDLPARLYLASSKLVRNDYKGAAEQFEAALKLDPTHLAALNDLAWTYLQLKDARAAGLAERAYKIADSNPAVIDTLGWIYVSNGNPARGLPLLKKAATLAPRAGDIRFHLGVGLARTGDKLNARKEFEQLLAENKDYARRDEVKAMLAAL
jgi:putative PEP-CTERM system TPR-repeat lipoprotein